MKFYNLDINSHTEIAMNELVSELLILSEENKADGRDLNAARIRQMIDIGRTVIRSCESERLFRELTA